MNRKDFQLVNIEDAAKLTHLDMLMGAKVPPRRALSIPMRSSPQPGYLKQIINSLEAVKKAQPFFFLYTEIFPPIGYDIIPYLHSSKPPA